ncbi:MAG: signal peptide peptidase SppA [Nibricoccus sp.]
MKNFFTSMLGTLAALAICGMGLFAVFLIFIGVVAAVGNKKPAEVEQGSYLVFDLETVISDAPPKSGAAQLLQELGGGDSGPTNLQLREITQALRAAAKDRRIAGVFIHGHLPSDGGNYSNGFAALKEVRGALQEIKAAGKPIVGYVSYASTRDMFVASVADDLAMDPYGVLYMPGLGAEPMFFAGAFEKFGIGVQVTRVGKYKSAVEPFTRKDLSPENREQLQKLLDDIWGDLVNDTATARGVTPAELQAVVDREGFIRADAALLTKLVNRVAYRDEVYDDLKKRTGRAGSQKPFTQVALSAYIDAMDDARGHRDGGSNKIAVVYAEGAIVDGEGGEGEIGGEKMSRELRRLRQDPDVKAIVLRVNSPGGSATASEHIQREVRMAKEAKKPVIVSMGSYAASGGYWISTYGDHIFAEPTTITGSIGVFGLLPNVQKLANNLGLTFDSVKTGKFATMMTASRPKTEEELALIQRAVDWIYSEFLAKVSESRHMELARVQEIAQGRVWSGVEAKKLGLVDDIGSLDNAIAFAAEKAGVTKNYSIEEYPQHKDFAEMISDVLAGLKPSNARIGGAITRLADDMREEFRTLEQFNDAQGIYARLPLEIRVK